MAYQVKAYRYESDLMPFGISRYPTIEKAMASAESWLSMGYTVIIKELEPSIYDL